VTKFPPDHASYPPPLPPCNSLGAGGWGRGEGRV